jgi:hypothetical protein
MVTKSHVCACCLLLVRDYEYVRELVKQLRMCVSLERQLSNAAIFSNVWVMLPNHIGSFQNEHPLL